MLIFGEGYSSLEELIEVGLSNWEEAYRIIRKFYLLNELRFSGIKHKIFKAYSTPIWRFMNPAERDFYMQYISIGGIALYPLYFAGGYFLDFANPGLKLGIEIDGKNFHDAEKDLVRDSDLGELGWIILRMTAVDVLKGQKYLSDIENEFAYQDNNEQQDSIKSFFESGSIGLLYALRALFFDRWAEDHDYVKYSREALFNRTTNEENLYELLYSK